MTNPVIIVVFDGLQPAQVTAELMPHLAGFAAAGVACHNHHAVFPTVTRANVASIVTGHYPGGHGLTGNMLVLPEYDPHRAINALEPQLAEIAARTPVLLRPTLGDLLRRHGQEYIAVGSGTSGNAWLQHPNAGDGGGATIHPDFCLPRPLYDAITARFGPWPPRGGPAAAKLGRAVDIFAEYVLAERRPAVSLLWLSEPDTAQHAHGVGAAESVAALRAADGQFGRLLARLDDMGLAAANVLAVSDHGYSTISGVVDLEAALRAAGFPPGDAPGGVTVAPNGGSALFYVYNEGAAGEGGDAAERLAQWLMAQPWCGSLVASDAVGRIAGTLPAALVGLEGPRAPALAMSFRWDSAVNAAGFAGHAYSTNLSPGKGQHGSMSRHETRNVLYARGPDFKQAAAIAAPTGNADLAPTILSLLGLPGGETMDGRILREILRGGPDAVGWHTDVHRAERMVANGCYRQAITVSQAGGAWYVDQGSGGVGPVDVGVTGQR